MAKANKLFVVTKSFMVEAPNVFQALDRAEKASKSANKTGDGARGVVTNVATNAQTFVDMTGDTPVVKPNAEATAANRVIGYSTDKVTEYTTPTPAAVSAEVVQAGS